MVAASAGPSLALERSTKTMFCQEVRARREAPSGPSYELRILSSCIMVDLVRLYPSFREEQPKNFKYRRRGHVPRQNYRAPS